MADLSLDKAILKEAAGAWNLPRRQTRVGAALETTMTADWGAGREQAKAILPDLTSHARGDYEAT